MIAPPTKFLICVAGLKTILPNWVAALGARIIVLYKLTKSLSKNPCLPPTTSSSLANAGVVNSPSNGLNSLDLIGTV